MYKEKINQWSRKVFFYSMFTVFTLISIHLFSHIRSILLAFAMNPDPSVSPSLVLAGLLHTPGEQIRAVCIDLLIWHADILVIFRTYLVWGKRWQVIVVPIIFLMLSIANGSVILAWFFQPDKIDFNKIHHPFFDLIFPLHLAGNTATTGLLAFKIWQRHWMSERAGINFHAVGSGPNLITILRIIVESAAIYTVQLALLVILYFAGDMAGQIVVLGTLTPSIGIVFVLITLRTHQARNDGSLNFENPMRSSFFGSEFIPDSTASQQGAAHERKVSVASRASRQANVSTDRSRADAFRIRPQFEDVMEHSSEADPKDTDTDSIVLRDIGMGSVRDGNLHFSKPPSDEDISQAKSGWAI
ncbi:hypothetical protein FA15DRAFT_710061 [Coprinopsis marcescibilis]|uniref:Uncharacterized protein n=1 Tax=Coprinopsis marcescibilis TaxID=230819 RepID=A0A5C3KE97_COPMA|nr:hypothetical protein FA15DRAFT_710061 [Coprinopsis marcescibilis]